MKRRAFLRLLGTALLGALAGLWRWLDPRPGALHLIEVGDAVGSRGVITEIDHENAVIAIAWTSSTVHEWDNLYRAEEA